MNRAARRQARSAAGRVPPATPVERIFAAAEAHRQAGRLQQASDFYREVLAKNPYHAPSLHRLGALAYQIGAYETATRLISNAVAIDDGIAAFHNDLGECQRMTGAKAEAVASFTRALQLAPGLASAMSNLALLLAEAGQSRAAIGLLLQAVASEPKNADYRINLGCLQLDANQIAEAHDTLATAARLAPGDAAAWLNLGNVLMRLDQPASAADCYRTVLRLEPAHVAAHLNLGMALREAGDAAAGLDMIRQATRLAPDLSPARWNEGLTNLVLGHMTEGWQGFGWRFRAGTTPPHGIDLPEWDGSPLTGKRLLIHAEQGLGDTLQFVRFLGHPALAAARRAAFLSQQPLGTLLAQTVSDLVDQRPDLADFDCRIALMDLPRVLELGDRVGAARYPYVAAPDQSTRHWADRIGDRPGLRVGIVWQGHAAHANDRNRSIPLLRLQPLWSVRDIDWYSLQKDAGPAPAPLIDLAPELADLTDTAAAIQALDLVIAVDTSVAHLAGALGKPVWLLLPFAPDWRWQLGRTDSPWYPSARLFRQARAGDWDGVVSDVAGALNAAASASSAATRSVPAVLS